MGDLYDYLEWRGELGFDDAPFNEIDGMIFSLISYADLGEAIGTKEGDLSADVPPPTLLTVARRFFKLHKGEKLRLGLIIPASMLNLLVKAAKTRRFGSCRVIKYVNHICADTETQFSAVSFLLTIRPSMLRTASTKIRGTATVTVSVVRKSKKDVITPDATDSSTSGLSPRLSIL